MDDATAKRMAENEATFRRFNEEIKSSAKELEYSDLIPFICECGNGRCREILQLTDDEYEAVRAEGTRFFVVPGHESVAGSAGEVLDRHENFFVVKKIGIAGEVSAELDPREQGDLPNTAEGQ